MVPLSILSCVAAGWLWDCGGACGCGWKLKNVPTGFFKIGKNWSILVKILIFEI
jgi:hypothetical protein